jgi:ATP-binding cassette subfamily B protein
LTALRLLVSYTWPSGETGLKLRFAGSAICLLLALAATAVSPLLLADLTDRFGHTTSAAVAASFAIVAAYVISRFLAQALAELRDTLFASILYDAMRKFGVRALSHVLSLSPRFFLEFNAGGTSRTIARGTEALGIFIYYAIFNIVPVLIQLTLFTLEAIYKLSIPIAFVMVTTVAAYAAFTFLLARRQMALRNAINLADTEVAAKLAESLFNYETVKYLNSEAHEKFQYDRSMGKYAHFAMQAKVSVAFLTTGQAIITAIGAGVVMALCAFQVRSGGFGVGGFVMANAIMVQLYQPLSSLAMVYREIMQAIVDTRSMADLLGNRREVEDTPEAKDLIVDGGEICFDHVRLAYETGRDVLNDISLLVPAGSIIGIVGASGSGKSSIARVLCRAYDLTGGKVLIDGQDILRVTQSSLRGAIGIVPQETVLFNDTIGYNIGYGNLAADQRDIQHAACVAGLDSFIQSLPDGYDTIVGERGLKLSGGEKQRLCIARAILKKPRILLLDEATSALDVQTERHVHAALCAVNAQQTVIVIAHRLSTVTEADLIVVLDHGSIVERGTHAELLARNGRYAVMWNKQREAATARERLEATAVTGSAAPPQAAE